MLLTENHAPSRRQCSCAASHVTPRPMNTAPPGPWSRPSSPRCAGLPSPPPRCSALPLPAPGVLALLLLAGVTCVVLLPVATAASSFRCVTECPDFGGSFEATGSGSGSCFFLSLSQPASAALAHARVTIRRIAPV